MHDCTARDVVCSESMPARGQQSGFSQGGIGWCFSQGVLDGASARGALDDDWSDDWLDEVISQMPDDISFANIHLV